jgi:hypothetical protein
VQESESFFRFLGSYIGGLYESAPAKIAGAAFAVISAFGIVLSLTSFWLWIALFLLGIVLVQIYVAYKDFRAPVSSGDAVTALIKRGFELEEELRGCTSEKEGRIAVMTWVGEALEALTEHAPEYRKDFSSQKTVEGTGSGQWAALLDRDIRLLSEARKEIGAR